MKSCLFVYVFIFQLSTAAQSDSLDNVRLAQMITLSEAVVRNDLNISGFIERVKNDTTFYKAFRNLRVLGFSSLNDIRMLDKKGKVKASLISKTKQSIAAGCRTMDVLEERVTGNFYEEDGDYNYYTAELYAGLFFANEKICGETNIVKGIQRSISSKKGIEKHKEQLKMLFFDPGKKVPGIPFMGDKTEIFDTHNATHYDFSLDITEYDGQSCYQFMIKAKEGSGGRVIIDNMTTWFNSKTMQVAGRNYSLSYKAGVYDFNVHMEVLMTQFGSLTVPKILRYNGIWDAAFKKRERGVFTATLFDFRD
jgi:hypothetical protein